MSSAESSPGTAAPLPPPPAVAPPAPAPAPAPTPAALTAAQAKAFGFRLLDENLLVHRRPRQIAEDDVNICDCRRETAGACCGTDACENRSTKIECLVGFCSKGRCQNMRLQRRQGSLVRVVDAREKGRGVVAAAAIAPAALVDEYMGEVLSEQEHERRMALYSRQGGHFYMMGLGRGEYLDAARCGKCVDRATEHSRKRRSRGFATRLECRFPLNR